MALRDQRFVADHNQQPKPFVWTADPNKIIQAVRRGHQVLDSIHSQVSEDIAASESMSRTRP